MLTNTGSVVDVFEAPLTKASVGSQGVFTMHIGPTFCVTAGAFVDI